MQQQRSRDTGTEMALRSELHRRGLRYRVHQRPIQGLRREADIVIRKLRLAIYVNGCFWHGCPEHATWPKTNATFWKDKIETNRQRDRDTDTRLERASWTVLRVWEHEAPTSQPNGSWRQWPYSGKLRRPVEQGPRIEILSRRLFIE
jgi:DNA mismatch endonuclease (patch repair protein)